MVVDIDAEEPAIIGLQNRLRPWSVTLPLMVLLASATRLPTIFHATPLTAAPVQLLLISTASTTSRFLDIYTIYHVLTKIAVNGVGPQVSKRLMLV